MAKLDSLNSWHSDWKQLRVGVIGLGVTGFSVADTLAELGAQLLVVADKAEPDLVDILDVLGVEHLIGPTGSQVPQRLIDFTPDVLVTSPGVKPDSAIMSWAQRNGITIWVDIDLAWRLRDKTDRIAQWFCITGTNGKTTTTQLTTAMLLAGGVRAPAGGSQRDRFRDRQLRRHRHRSGERGRTRRTGHARAAMRWPFAIPAGAWRRWLADCHAGLFPRPAGRSGGSR